MSTVYTGQPRTAPDTVVVVMRGRAQTHLAASRARQKKEAANRTQFEAGQLGLDLYGMRDALARKGLTDRRYGQ